MTCGAANNKADIEDTLDMTYNLENLMKWAFMGLHIPFHDLLTAVKCTVLWLGVAHRMVMG
jgi:hypothetical protein